MITNFDCKHSFRCWECPTPCEIKQLLLLPDFLFMPILNDTYKSCAGFMLSKGVPFDIVETNSKIFVLTLITSRMMCN